MAEQHNKKPKGKPSDWELESSFDLASSLEELINSPPFKEASDEKGDSVTSGTRVPMWLHRRIVKLREMEGAPYEVNSDVLRDAVYLGLQVLHMRYGMSQDWDVEKKMAAVVDASGALRRHRSLFETLVAGLDELFEEGDADQAAHRLSEYVAAADKLENKWHRSTIFKMLVGSKVVKEVSRLCSKEIRNMIYGETKNGSTDIHRA